MIVLGAACLHCAPLIEVKVLSLDNVGLRYYFGLPARGTKTR